MSINLKREIDEFLDEQRTLQGEILGWQKRICFHCQDENIPMPTNAEMQYLCENWNPSMSISDGVSMLVDLRKS